MSTANQSSAPINQIEQNSFIGQPASSSVSSISKSESVNNIDVKMLQNLQKVYGTYISDCLRLTNWSNIEQVTKHKELLHKRILSVTEQFFFKINSQGQQQQARNPSLQPEQTSSFQRSDQNKYGSGMNNDEEEQKRRHLRDCNNQDNEGSSKIRRESSQSLSDGSQENEEEEEEYNEEDLKRRKKFRRIPNPDSKYQCSDFRREQFPDVGYSRSIANYPLAEKKRVLDFFNAHYDPAKRNKIDIVQKIIHSLHYSYSSIYYLVSNQGPNKESQAEESLNPSQNQSQQYEQFSINNSIMSTYSTKNKQKSSQNPPKKPRYQNQGCYLKPGRPPKNSLIRFRENASFDENNPNDESRRSMRSRNDDSKIYKNYKMEDEIDKSKYSDSELFGV